MLREQPRGQHGWSELAVRSELIGGRAGCTARRALSATGGSWTPCVVGAVESPAGFSVEGTQLTHIGGCSIAENREGSREASADATAEIQARKFMVSRIWEPAVQVGRCGQILDRL